MRRNFLFLQGVCSPFFARLADRLVADGHRVYKINFNAGDLAYWGGRPAWSFRGEIAGLRDFLDQKYRQFDITDQILFGDRRPVHRPAIDHGDAFGIRSHVFEEGYFRPYWVTLEREGVNGHSLLPRDPEWFRRVGGELPDYGHGQPFQLSFTPRAIHDVLYHTAGALNPLLYPSYRTHAPVSAPVEYAGYVYRYGMMPFWKRRDRALIDRLLRDRASFYLLPLQLNSDAQIRDHSRFADMAEVMDFVMASFARQAPADTRLVIKNHPLDMGLVNYPRIIAGLSRKYDLDGRIDYIESGNLHAMLLRAKGLVTVNSTAGGFSVELECPTVTLSDPIYNLPGLTFQGGLDDFWQNAQRPDKELFRRFRNTVIHTTQVNGGFYSSSGIERAVVNCQKILEAERSPLELLL